MYINKHIGGQNNTPNTKCVVASPLYWSVSSENGGIYHEGHRLPK